MTKRALVIGAGGAVGEAAVHALLKRGWRVVASMRRPRPEVAQRLQQAGADVVQHTLPEADWRDAARGCDTVIFSTHLPLTNAALDDVQIHAARVVAFSSNNVAADADAPSYRALAEAEAAFRARYPAGAIIRPTMIYGDPRLVTVTRLMRLAQRSPVLPMPGSGRALMQPVFHADLGELTAALAEADEPSGTFAAGGPDVVRMREFYAAIARAVGAHPLIAPLPGLALHIASTFGLISSEQARRAEADRSAIPQDPLPPALAPRTSLAEGLNALAAAMASASDGG